MRVIRARALWRSVDHQNFHHGFFGATGGPDGATDGVLDGATDDTVDGATDVGAFDAGAVDAGAVGGDTTRDGIAGGAEGTRGGDAGAGGFAAGVRADVDGADGVTAPGARNGGVGSRGRSGGTCERTSMRSPCTCTGVVATACSRCPSPRMSNGSMHSV